MKAFSFRSLIIAAIVCFGALFTSCSKEALVEPVQQHVTGGSNGTSSQNGSSTGGAVITSTSTVNPGGDRGISDDGDDLSGSERNRKNRKN